MRVWKSGKSKTNVSLRSQTAIDNLDIGGGFGKA